MKTDRAVELTVREGVRKFSKVAVGKRLHIPRTWPPSEHVVMIGSLFGRSAIVGSLAPSIAASALKPMVPSEAAAEPSTLTQ